MRRLTAAALALGLHGAALWALPWALGEGIYKEETRSRRMAITVAMEPQAPLTPKSPPTIPPGPGEDLGHRTKEAAHPQGVQGAPYSKAKDALAEDGRSPGVETAHKPNLQNLQDAQDWGPKAEAPLSAGQSDGKGVLDETGPMGPQAPSTSGAADPPEGALELDGRDLAVRRSVPPYPLSSRRRGEEGTVVVCLWVSRGRPERGEIRSSSGHKALDEAAKRAAMDWRFKEDLSGTVLIPFRFSLKD